MTSTFPFLLMRRLATTCFALLATLAVAPSAEAQLPAQPTALSAIHRDGQTFLTWTASVDVDVEAYQVYRSSAPIDALNLASADPIYRVTAGSSDFIADRYLLLSQGSWAPRYLERFVIEDFGQQLAADQELLVWTIAEADVGPSGTGDGYYAVTAVRDDGTENTADLLGGNTLGPVNESVSTPRAIPVLDLPTTGGTVYTQFLDLRRFNETLSAPNANNSHYGLDPLDPEVAGATAYAFNYVVFPPDTSGCTPSAPSYPAVLVLHGFGGQTVRPYVTFEPESSWCSAYRIYPIDPSNTWWFGGGADHDYRLDPVPAGGGSTRNFTEQRVLRMLDDLIAEPIGSLPVDPERVFVVGQSMGGTGTLAFAMRYPQVFAAAYAGQPMTNPTTIGNGGGTDWKPDLETVYGREADALPYIVDADAPYQAPLVEFDGVDTWLWQNHQATLAGPTTRERVPFGIDHGLLDTVIEWPTQGEPMYSLLDASTLCWSGEVTATQHVSSQEAGLIQAFAKVSGRPFSDFSVIRSETLPALVQAASNPPLPPVAAGSFNTAYEWSSTWSPWDGTPTDEVDRWSISLRKTGLADTVRVAPRRTQQFQVQPGDVLRWTNARVGDGVVVTSGTFVVPPDGLALTPPVGVTSNGNRITLERTLKADVDSVSVTAGGTQTLSLLTGADQAGELYIMLGSMSGSTPPLPLGDGSALPLAVFNPLIGATDVYFQLTLASPNQPFLQPSFAALDGSGEGTCSFTLAPGAPASLVGETLHHAYAIIDPIALQGRLGSNAVAVELVP